jgi:hypothetical protein
MGKKKVLNKQKIKNRTLVLSQKPSLSIHSELRQQNRAKRRRMELYRKGFICVNYEDSMCSN